MRTNATITKALWRGVVLATLAGFGLAVTPGITRAQSITFTVVEGVVPGTPDNTFEADLLNGGYSANLVLVGDADPADGTGSGTWSETAAAAFSQYFLGGTALVNPFIGDVEPDGYSILGSFDVERHLCRGRLWGFRLHHLHLRGANRFPWH